MACLHAIRKFIRYEDKDGKLTALFICWQCGAYVRRYRSSSSPQRSERSADG